MISTNNTIKTLTNKCLQIHLQIWRVSLTLIKIQVTYYTITCWLTCDLSDNKIIWYHKTQETWQIKWIKVLNNHKKNNPVSTKFNSV